MKRLCFSVILFLCSTFLVFSQFVVVPSLSAYVPNRTVPKGWRVSTQLYLKGDMKIKGVDVVVSYPKPISHLWGEYVYQWQFPHWDFPGVYVTQKQDTMHFALVGIEGFQVSGEVSLGYFPLFVELGEGEKTRLGVSVSVIARISGRDTLIRVPYEGGTFTGAGPTVAGDADGDGSYSIIDPLRALEISSGDYEATLSDSVRADVSGDWFIDSNDGWEILHRVVYPYWTFPVLQGVDNGKGMVVPSKPVEIQLAETGGGVQISLPPNVKVRSGDLVISGVSGSSLVRDENLERKSTSVVSRSKRHLSFFVSGDSLSGKIAFVPNVRARDLNVTGTVDNGIRIVTKIENATSVGDVSQKPDIFSLSQNYPNPFNPTTNVSYALPTNSVVRLSVYNLLGQEVAKLVNGEQQAGTHSVPFDASRLSSGTYVYRITAGSFTAAKKMVLMK